MSGQADVSEGLYVVSVMCDCVYLFCKISKRNKSIFFFFFFFCVSAAETSVQQDSKQIQVDLQDPGYETCGRSENEAEREDTSSPGRSDCYTPSLRSLYTKSKGN